MLYFQLFFYFIHIVGLLGAAIINKEVVRNIDVTTPIMRITIAISAVNVEDEYIISFPTEQAKSIAFISASANNDRLLIDSAVR